MSAHGHNTDDEMHELNLEADYLEQKTSKRLNGRHNREHSDPDAQALVIESLKSQIQDLFSQVTQLNTKLVKSYDRVSDLEDELHVTSANLRTSTLKVSNLELERTQHLSALSTGLLVEKDHVTSELTRLMERATEEAARRGQAESAQAAIEKELDDLSAGLFDQANRMVAEARLARARSERKADETEEALKGAEEVVGVLQAQMQALQTEKEQSERKMTEMRAIMGKGKWVSRPDPFHTYLRHLSSHLPYHEYLQFIAHLRSIRPSSLQVPAVTSLLPLPFLARLVSEDSDPTIRLDLAPSLNWLTRRSVLSAIHSGQLTVEPMSTHTLLEELTPPTIPASSHNTHVNCALCGSLIFEPLQSSSATRISYPQSPSRNGTWSSALKSSLQNIATAANSTSASRLNIQNPATEPPIQVYIFRLASTSSSGLPVSLPISQQSSNAQHRPTIYPLCTSGWCLARLRTTCTLWGFIRTNIVEKVWEEDLFTSATLTESRKLGAGAIGLGSSTASDAQIAVPTKRSRIGIGAIWGTMQRGLSGTKGDESPKSQTSKSDEQPISEARAPSKSPPTRRLPPPPPRHPPLSAPISASTVTPAIAKLPSGPPPPLPTRNRTRESRPNSLDISDSGVASEMERAEAEQLQTNGTEPDKANVPVPPVALSRNESHDSFSTPTEELSPANLTRPGSPSSIPLPSSCPPTPLAGEFSPLHTQGQDETDKADLQPSVPGERIPSPLVLSLQPEFVKHDEPPRAATPSGMPPPLPRRAAARARPVSVIAVAPSAQATESSAQAAENTKAEDKDHNFADADKYEVDHERSQPSDVYAPPLLPRDTPHPSAVVMPISDDPNAVSLEKLDEVQQYTPPWQEDEGVADREGRGVEDDVGPDFDRGRPLSAAEPGRSQEETRFDVQEDDDESPFSEPPQHIEEDSGVYVGEASWEERTWKELVKLREDMFYARMGCVR